MAKVDFRNDNQQDERLDPYSENARDLYRQENDAPDSDTDEGSSQTADAGGEAAKTKNIDETKDKEERGGDWTTDVSEKSGQGSNKKQPVTFLQQARKKGPMGIIIALFGGGGLLGGSLLSPAGALIHIKEILVNKFDTMSSVVEERYVLIMSKRMFATNATCKIKVRCRFSGVTNRQMERLRIQGADILDKDGKPLKRNKFGRYTGGVTLAVPNDDGSITKVAAKDFKGTFRSNSAVRGLSRSVFAPRWSSWNDRVSKDIRAKKRLVTNPGWGEGDEKDARKNVFKAVSGEGFTAESQDAAAADKYETNSDGSIKKDANGDPIPKAGTKELGDMGEFADAINEESDRLKTAAGNGDLIDEIPSDPAGAANMAESKIGSSVAKKAIGFLNPLDILSGMCGAVKVAKTMIYGARAYLIINAMRYASQFLSTADKIKAGEATSNDAEQAMTILERTDQYGDNFGDAAGYQYAEYGTVPDKPLGFSATGNGVILVLSTIVGWLNSHIGKTTLRVGCNVATNPFFQGAMALTSFIPGGGQVTGLITKVGVKAAETGAKALIKDMVKKMIEAAAKKLADKEALKAAAKVAGREFLKLAASAGGIFLAQYLLQRYAVPYLARISSDTMLNGNESGPTAMDTTAGGIDATNQVTGQEGGLVPLTKDQATKFEAFNDSSTATYVADMRAESNPLDIMNPYSASNALASSFYTFASKLKQSSLLTAPGVILSSLNIGSLFGSAASADTVAFGDDEYLNDRGLATSPFNTTVMGYNDLDMLQNADPDTDVTQWMLDHKQIDGDGNAVPDSDWAKFQDKCFTDAVIADPDVIDGAIDPTCTDPKENATTERKMFHLYKIDSRTIDGMDTPPTDTAATTSTNKYIKVGNIPETGLTVGASVFGGKQQGGKWVENLADNGGNDNGNGGAHSCNPNDPHLTGTSSFAELDMGKALGNIPDCTKLEIKDNATGKTIIAAKMDIGAGGADVQGHKRAVDLWWQAANALGFSDGTGVVTIHAVDPGTDLTPVATTGNSSDTIGFSLGNFLSLNSLFSSPIKGIIQ